MVTREEATKMRKELIRAERILAQKEKATASKPDFTPMILPEKNNPSPETQSEVPNVIHLPKKRRQRQQNKAFY